MRRILALLAPCVIAASMPLAAQKTPDRPVLVLAGEGGAYPHLESPHLVYGGTAHLRVAGWGLLGLGLIGKSDEYESRMFGGAVSRQLFRSRALHGGVFVGYGEYSETGWSGIERAAPGIMGGATLSLESSRFIMQLTALEFRGRYQGNDVLAPFNFSAPRVTLGVGVNVIP